MNPRDIVLATFQLKSTPIVPYWLPMEDEVALELDRHWETPNWHEKIIPFVIACHWGWEPQIDTSTEGRMRDPFGSIVEIGNILHVTRPALSSPCLVGYRWPEITELENWERMDALYSDKKESFRLAGLGLGLFERSCQMRGFENFLVDLLDHPSFVEKLLDGITDIHLRAMEFITQRVQLDAYFGGDDWCGQRGPIMSLRMWRKFFKPRLAEIIKHCHELGLPYVCHSCGNVAPLVDDLLDIGLDGLESLQPEAMDVYELKRKTSGKLFLMGGLGSQSVLWMGTPAQVRRETKKLIKYLARGGGYILAPSKPLMAGMPIANAAAFIETACGQP